MGSKPSPWPPWLLTAFSFFVGLLAGLSACPLLFAPAASCVPVAEAPSSSLVHTSNHPSELSRPAAPKGWTYYSVYRGLPSDPQLTQKLPSQAGQDAEVLALFNSKSGGYFVDLAANDAYHWSNTLHLEQQLG